MVNLLLAVISSAMVSIVMRLAEKKTENNMGMLVVNYVVCSLLSLAFHRARSLNGNPTGMGTALGLGTVTGILYLVSFMLLQYNVSKNGVVLAATFMKLGVIIPTLMAIVVFGETPKTVHILGILIALAAIILINSEKKESGNADYKILLVLLLLSSGIGDSMTNVYDKTGNSDMKDLYLFATFAVAGFCAFIIWLLKKQKRCKWDILFGAVIGIPNYFSSKFLLGALQELQAVLVYPAFSVLSIVLVCVIGFVCFKEKLSRRKLSAIGLILVSLVLINL